MNNSGAKAALKGYRFQTLYTLVEILESHDSDNIFQPEGVIGQASSYRDEWDSFIEAVKEADDWAFQNFVIANTSSDPAQALQRLLPSFSGCPALFAKRFQLELDLRGQVIAIIEIR
ncbi:hypothetical protein [Methylovulum miyakonense]|uniref:hypothetical protein n=1 Tax=Methylovulum miyakonense TaxID=645578 RepID=UPI00036A3BC7|nr:hypothetical protein [Methylovulum miyakonense]